MISDSELRALAALAEAATPGIDHPSDQQLDEWLRECAGPLLFQREGGIRMALINALKQLRAAASPDVVRELVERVLKTEAVCNAVDDRDIDAGDREIGKLMDKWRETQR